jgi:outer membrane protein assembly factor BamB
VGELVFIGSCVGTYFALDRKTGQVRWSYDISQDGDQTSFHGNPLVVNDLIITGTDGSGVGHVYAFETATGKVRWKHAITKGVSNGFGLPTDIVRLGDSLFGVTLGDELVSLNANSGKVNWTFASGYNGKSFRWSQSPAAAGDRVFFGGINGMLYALSAESGQILWRRELGTRVSTNLTVSGNDLYAGTAGGNIYRLDSKTGEITGEMKLETTPVGWPTLTGESLLVFLNRGGGAGVAKALLSLDPALKHIRWQKPASSNWSLTRPFLWRAMVLAGNEEGEVKAFRLSDGEEQWTANLKGMIRSLGSDEKVLYIGTIAGTVTAYQPGK